MRHHSLILIAAATACTELAGCSALTSTTHRTGDGITAVGRGTAHVTRATSNASITEPDVPRYAAAEAFARSQMPILKREAAEGGGEHVQTLALLLGERRDRLGAWLQQHYSRLFAAGRPTDARALVTRIAARQS